MLIYIVFVSLLALSNCRDIARTGRINGGTLVDITEAPYTVSLSLNYGNYYHPVCGGAVIDPTVIVTVASCTERTRANQWMVRAGSTFNDVGGQPRVVEKKVEHEKFDNSLDNDIALLYLQDALILGPWVAPVVLPSPQQPIIPGSLGVISGWGFVIDQGPWFNELRRVQLPVLNSTACDDAYVYPVSKNMFCAGHLEGGIGGACQGDGGGPLIIDGLLMGVSSWGQGCGRPGEPGVYTRIPNYVQWIDINVQFPPKDDNKIY